MPAESLIIPTDRGLYCPAGDFYVDAWKPVARNIVTHAHSDHARRGSERYLTAKEGEGVLRARLGNVAVDAVEYGQHVDLNSVHVSLHPAGHVLGSAQVRIESHGQVVVLTGDYKRQTDSTCRPFELIRCHTFVTECTFGLPIFQWDDPQMVHDEINQWWRDNQAAGRTSIMLAYSLGKAQRVLSQLDPTIGPVLLHGAAYAMVNAYRESSVQLPPTEHATVENAKRHRGRAMVIAPSSAMNSSWPRKFAPYSIGVASGWMRVPAFRKRSGVDRGFVLSDHVDFPSLMRTIAETGAEHVIATHGYTDVLVRLMREQGRTASAFETKFIAEEIESAGAEGPEE